MVGIFGDKGNALQLGIRSLLFFFLYFMIGWVGVWYISGFRDRHLTIGELLGGTCITMFFGIGCLFMLSGSSDAGNKKNGPVI